MTGCCHPHSTEIPSGEIPGLRSAPSALCSDAGHHQTKSSPVLLAPTLQILVCTVQLPSQPSLLQANSLRPSDRPHQEVLQPLASLQPSAGLSKPFPACSELGSPALRQCSSCDLLRTDQRGGEAPSSAGHTLGSAARVPLVFLPQGHTTVSWSIVGGPLVNCWSFGTPGSFSAELVPAAKPPSCTAVRVVRPPVNDLHLFLLNLIRSPSPNSWPAQVLQDGSTAFCGGNHPSQLRVTGSSLPRQTATSHQLAQICAHRSSGWGWLQGWLLCRTRAALHLQGSAPGWMLFSKCLSSLF